MHRWLLRTGGDLRAASHPPEPAALYQRSHEPSVRALPAGDQSGRAGRLHPIADWHARLGILVVRDGGARPGDLHHRRIGRGLLRRHRGRPALAAHQRLPGDSRVPDGGPGRRVLQSYDAYHRADRCPHQLAVGRACSARAGAIAAQPRVRHRRTGQRRADVAYHLSRHLPQRALHRRRQLHHDHHPFAPPGICIALLGCGLALLNFGIDEIADPRLRQARRRPGLLSRYSALARRVRLGNPARPAPAPGEKVVDA